MPRFANFSGLADLAKAGQNAANHLVIVREDGVYIRICGDDVGGYRLGVLSQPLGRPRKHLELAFRLVFEAAAALARVVGPDRALQLQGFFDPELREIVRGDLASSRIIKADVRRDVGPFPDNGIERDHRNLFLVGFADRWHDFRRVVRAYDDGVDALG